MLACQRWDASVRRHCCTLHSQPPLFCFAASLWLFVAISCFVATFLCLLPSELVFVSVLALRGGMEVSSSPGGPALAFKGTYFSLKTTCFCSYLNLNALMNPSRSARCYRDLGFVSASVQSALDLMLLFYTSRRKDVEKAHLKVFPQNSGVCNQLKSVQKYVYLPFIIQRVNIWAWTFNRGHKILENLLIIHNKK